MPAEHKYNLLVFFYTICLKKKNVQALPKNLRRVNNALRLKHLIIHALIKRHKGSQK